MLQQSVVSSATDVIQVHAEDSWEKRANAFSMNSTLMLAFVVDRKKVRCHYTICLCEFESYCSYVSLSCGADRTGVAPAQIGDTSSNIECRSMFGKREIWCIQGCVKFHGPCLLLSQCRVHQIFCGVVGPPGNKFRGSMFAPCMRDIEWPPNQAIKAFMQCEYPTCATLGFLLQDLT
jgi:hypothetical protein